MKGLTSTRLCSLFLAGVALSCFAVGAANAAARSSTAQSLQFVLTAGTNYIIEGTEAWKYEDAVAATNFTNQVTGGPTFVRCSGSPTNCATGNAPSPTLADAPAADDQKLADVVRDNKCNFWSGTTLTGTTYTQQKTFNGQNGSGNWVYSYSYTIAPIQTSYPAKTAWLLLDSSTTFPTVSVDGFLAGQSTVLKALGTTPWDFKASHTILNADGTPRLDATLTLTNNANSETVGQVDLVLGTNYEIESGVTWNYQATPGLIFGDSQQLFTGEV
jgi:hypothetical protein